MKLSFRKEDLQSAVSIVSRAIPTRTANPILECILFDAEAAQIRLIANDLELGIETKAAGIIEERGKIALDAKLISEIIRKAEGDGEITISSEPDLSVTIKSDGSVFRIQGRDANEFPYLTYVEKDHYITLSQFTLKDVVRQIMFSANLNDSNKMMGGANVEVNGTNVRFTTLDGHRVAVRNIEMKDDYGQITSILPVRSLNEISRIIPGDNEKEVAVFFSKNYALFEFDDTSVLTRVIDGEYFRIAHMLTKDHDTSIHVNKNRLISAVDRSMIFVRESDHKPIILNLTEEGINISIRSAIGAMDEDIPCEKKGRDLKIAFNPKFLLDALRVIDDEEVDLYFTNAKAPCFIRDEKESYIYLILPVNFIE